jgi:hypothetical protein
MATVVVSCKTPNGFIMEVDGVTQVINGWNSKEALVIRLLDGTQAALTSDVDAEFWKKWLSIYKDHPLVANGNVFAESTENTAKAATKERTGVKSGMEALDPNVKVDGVEKETK